MLIVLAGLLAAALVVPENLDFLVGIYAFGAMLAFTIAHLSVCRLRYSEPDRDRPYRMPLSVTVRGGELPLPAVLGALVSRRRLAGGDRRARSPPATSAWAGWRRGSALYVIYRRADDNSLLRRVTVSPEMLRAEQHARARLRLDPRAAVRARRSTTTSCRQRPCSSPASPPTRPRSTPRRSRRVWIFEMPMALPLDARLPDAQVKHARQALARAKAVGEEYTGVHVATATVRARRAGHAIVEEARRRGVEAIVLGAEEPSRIRGGARLGGRGGRSRTTSGDITKYVSTRPPAG